jgi:hypothetical protein
VHVEQRSFGKLPALLESCAARVTLMTNSRAVTFTRLALRTIEARIQAIAKTLHQ